MEEAEYFKAILQDKTPDILIKAARRMAPKYRRNRDPNWVIAMNLFGVGSTFGWWICAEYGLDPDSTK